jgi:hypothetical protein
VVEAVTTVTRRWAQLTGQPQDWALFAPNVRGDSVFPAVELHWDEDSRGADRSMPRAAELLLSDNEPADPHHFLRVGRFRLRRYEGSLAVMLTAYEEETPDETKARWRERIERFLRKDWDAVRAYLRWRMRTWAERHPDRPPPRQAVLLMRRYQIPGPDEAGPFDWGGPYTEPVARWGPDTTWPGGHLPVEMYNPVTGRFQWLRYRGGG